MRYPAFRYTTLTLIFTSITKSHYVTVFSNVYIWHVSPFFYCCVDSPLEAYYSLMFAISDWALPQLTSTMDCSDFSIPVTSPLLFSSLLETYSFKRSIEISQVPKRYVHDHALLSDSSPDVDTHLYRIQVFRLPPYEKGQPVATLYHFGAQSLHFRYGLITPFLSLHVPDHSDTWKVQYGAGG